MLVVVGAVGGWGLFIQFEWYCCNRDFGLESVGDFVAQSTWKIG